MTPEVCVATIDALPATGGDGAALLPLVVVGVLVLGAGALLLLARGRRRTAAGAALALALVLGASVAVVAPAPAAVAATGGVSYSDGCTLVRVSDVVVAPPAERLLPGDEVRAVSAVVANPTDAAISLTLAPRIDEPLASAVTARVSAGGLETDTVVLAPGESIAVALVLALPTTAGDDLQGVSAATALLVSAMQR